jgi:hypothetical protein
VISEIVGDLVSCGLPQELRLVLELRLVQELRLRDQGDLVSCGLPQELRLVLELRLVQELRLRDQGDLVSYGLPQELRLALGLRPDPESFRLSARWLPRLNHVRLSLRATARPRATALTLTFEPILHPSGW